MSKTWYQHDMNCRKKDGLSFLRKAGGNRAYGEFHILQELWLEMQQHRPEAQNWFIINESTLLRELGINSRSLPKRIEMFYQTIGIVFEKICKTIANVSYINWQITMPKSLIFIDRNRHTNNTLKDKKEDAQQITAPKAPTSTSTTPTAKKPRKTPSRKTSFENSPIYDIDKFREAFPVDWTLEEVAYWHNQGIASSNRGNKYVGWDVAIKGWRRDSPDQFRDWKAKQAPARPSTGAWGGVRPDCGFKFEKDKKRFICSLKKGHDGPHKWVELYDGSPIDRPGPVRIDRGLQKLDCSGLIAKPGEDAIGKSDVSHGT